MWAGPVCGAGWSITANSMASQWWPCHRRTPPRTAAVSCPTAHRVVCASSSRSAVAQRAHPHLSALGAPPGPQSQCGCRDPAARASRGQGGGTLASEHEECDEGDAWGSETKSTRGTVEHTGTETLG